MGAVSIIFFHYLPIVGANKQSLKKNAAFPNCVEAYLHPDYKFCDRSRLLQMTYAILLIESTQLIDNSYHRLKRNIRFGLLIDGSSNKKILFGNVKSNRTSRAAMSDHFRHRIKRR